MTAVASNHVGEGLRGSDATSSFTAVNGNGSPAPLQAKVKVDHESRDEDCPMASSNHQEAAKENRSNGDDTSRKERKMSSGPPPPPASVPAPASGTGVAASPQVSPRQPRPQYPQQEGSGSPSSQSATTASTTFAGPQNPSAVMSPQKRKRSFSHERSAPSAGAYQNGGPPPSPGRSRMHGDMANGHPEPFSPRHTYPPPPDMYQQPPPDAYPPPPHHSYPPPPDGRPTHPEIYPRPDRHSIVRNEYDQPMDPSIAAPGARPYYTEAQLAEALQRGIQGREAYGSPEEDDDHQGQYADYNGNRSSQSGVEMDRKRRKRVFSNRTKTGCMTCRRRKKKCDEQHPECNNCLRGGFVCEGYTMRNTWQKPTNAKQPIPLQSKNGYPPQPPPPGRPPYPPGAPMPRYQDVSPEYPVPPPHPMHGPHPSYDGKRGDPIPIEDDRDGMYGRPGDEKGQPPWPKAARPYPSNPPQASKYQENDRRGSIYEMGADGQEPSGMNPPPPVNRTGSAQSHYSQVPHPPSHNTPPSQSNAQAAAQAALTHPASCRSQPRNRHDGYTEREKMLKGLYYYPNTPALTEDRERCIAAIWRFNNATNPSHGASPEERTRLFRQILSLRPTPEPPLSTGETPPTNFALPFGHCGERVVVEAPFHCDYGYNITIGDDVLIGADCRISDTCSVTIGARCIFSPNVKLVCATYPIDPRRRMGSGGPALGRNIVIEEDCWIGANVTILAGVRVGKSSTVGAGSLLHQDVPRFTVVAGNPAKVSRGIYDGSGDGQ